MRRKSICSAIHQRETDAAILLTACALSVFVKEERLIGRRAVNLNDSPVGADFEAADKDVGGSDMDASTFLSAKGVVVDEGKRMVFGPGDAT